MAKKEWTACKSVECFEMDGLLCSIDQTPVKDKMGQSTVLEDVRSKFEAARPGLNLARKEWTGC
jgi:hypothetical protein